jgi:hypothetical protein
MGGRSRAATTADGVPGAPAPTTAAIDPARTEATHRANRFAPLTSPTYSDDIGMSRYNAFQLKAQQRFARASEHAVLHVVEDGRHEQRLVRRRGRSAADPSRTTGTSTPLPPSYEIPHIPTWASIWEMPFGGSALRRGALILELAGELDAGPVSPADDRRRGRPGQSRLQQLLAGRPGRSEPGRSHADKWFNTAAFAARSTFWSSGTASARRATGTWT